MTQAPDNEELSRERTDGDEHHLAELANHVFDTEGPAVAATVAKLAEHHLNRDFAATKI